VCVCGGCNPVSLIASSHTERQHSSRALLVAGVTAAAATATAISCMQAVATDSCSLYEPQKLTAMNHGAHCMYLLRRV
jgi:hypothetical protein